MKTLVESIITSGNAFAAADLPSRRRRGWWLWLACALLLVCGRQAMALTDWSEHGGFLRVISGTGDLAAVSVSNKTLYVEPGATLLGTVGLRATNGSAPNNIAPLIWTPSWGEPRGSYREINSWIRTGETNHTADIIATVPSTPGTYYLIFAFGWEIGSDHVASGTNWSVGPNDWNDGNEIARISAAQIAEAQANGKVRVRRVFTDGTIDAWLAVDAITLIVGSSNQEVPVIGGGVAGAPEGTKYLAFGTPQVGAFAATISSGGSRVSAIIGADRKLLLRVSDAVPGLAGSVIATLGQPSGDAVLATLRISSTAGISSRNNVVLLRGLSTRTPVVAARTGTMHSGLPVGATTTRFITIDGNGSAIFFSATVQSAGAKPAAALCAALGDGSVKLLARAGDQVDGRSIARIAMLVGSAATLAEGRWRVDEETVGLRVTFTGTPATQALYAIPVDAASTADWIEIPSPDPSDTIPGLGTVKMLSFGLPGFGPGANAAIVAKRTNVPDDAAATNKQALLALAPGNDPTVFIQTGDPIDTDANGLPLSRVTAAAFSDPIVGQNQQIAFVVTGSAAFRGIMVSEAGGVPYVVANVGAAAPGGGHWASLGALVLPDGAVSGPVFTGTLRISRTDGITSATNRGVWGVDSTGELRLRLRSGQPVTVNGSTKTLASFSALTAAPGSIGAASGHDDSGNLAVVATFTDRTRALLDLTIP